MSNSGRQVLAARPANVETPTRKRTRSGSLANKDEAYAGSQPPAKKFVIDTPKKKIGNPIDVNLRKTAQRTKYFGVESISQPSGLRRRIDSIEHEASIRHAQWQLQYRDAFPRWSFYLDAMETSTKQKLTKQISSLSGRVETFFSSKVTHVVTAREVDLLALWQEHERSSTAQENDRLSEILPNASLGKGRYLSRSTQVNPLMEETRKADVLVKAHEMGIKVWKIAKFINIINNIIGDAQSVVSKSKQNLSKLLQEERVHGSTERDPLARRDDHIYFSGPHVFVRDLSETYRPIIVKEYARPKRDSEGSWPQIHQTSEGKCPFIPESRQRSVNDGKTNTRSLKRLPISQAQNMRRFNEIQASGMHMSNLTSHVRSATSTTARSVTLSVPSKEVNSLKRKVLDRHKPVDANNNQMAKQKAAAKPGYCENCRDKYEDFSEVCEDLPKFPADQYSIFVRGSIVSSRQIRKTLSNWTCSLQSCAAR